MASIITASLLLLCFMVCCLPLIYFLQSFEAYLGMALVCVGAGLALLGMVLVWTRHRQLRLSEKVYTAYRASPFPVYLTRFWMLLCIVYAGASLYLTLVHFGVLGSLPTTWVPRPNHIYLQILMITQAVAPLLVFMAVFGLPLPNYDGPKPTMPDPPRPAPSNGRTGGTGATTTADGDGQLTYLVINERSSVFGAPPQPEKAPPAWPAQAPAPGPAPAPYPYYGRTAAPMSSTQGYPTSAVRSPDPNALRPRLSLSTPSAAHAETIHPPLSPSTPILKSQHPMTTRNRAAASPEVPGMQPMRVVQRKGI